MTWTYNLHRRQKVKAQKHCQNTQKVSNPLSEIIQKLFWFGVLLIFDNMSALYADMFKKQDNQGLQTHIHLRRS